MPVVVVPRLASCSRSSIQKLTRRLLASSFSHKATGEQDMRGFAYKQHGADDPPRLTCTRPECGFIAYENPKIVTGAVATYPDPSTGEPLYLLCRRAIPPRKGYLNLCAGYMEARESLSAAAAREAKEEASASIRVGPILSIYDIPHISQVHIYFSATLTSPDVDPGYESLDVQLVKWNDIDWDELAFPTVSWALMAHRQFHDQGKEGAGGGGGGQLMPYRNPVLPGHEGSTNVWYNPRKGGLVYDETWLQRRGPPPSALKSS